MIRRRETAPRTSLFIWDEAEAGSGFLSNAASVWAMSSVYHQHNLQSCTPSTCHAAKRDRMMRDGRHQAMRHSHDSATHPSTRRPRLIRIQLFLPMITRHAPRVPRSRARAAQGDGPGGARAGRRRDGGEFERCRSSWRWDEWGAEEEEECSLGRGEHVEIGLKSVMDGWV